MSCSSSRKVCSDCGEYISLFKSCHIRRKNECVRVKRHWVTEWNRKNEGRGREKHIVIVRDREQLQLTDTPWGYTTLTERTSSLSSSSSSSGPSGSYDYSLSGHCPPLLSTSCHQDPAAPNLSTPAPSYQHCLSSVVKAPHAINSAVPLTDRHLLACTVAICNNHRTS